VEFTQWISRFSVGDPMMDAYHHIFFETIRDFAMALPDLSSVAVEERIQFLTHYATMHFESEERLLEKIGYPELESHQESHRLFKEQITLLQQAYQASPSMALAEKLLDMSQGWLKDHILREDMNYKTYVTKQAGNG
jgi:hemerythrin